MSTNEWCCASGLGARVSRSLCILLAVCASACSLPTFGLVYGVDVVNHGQNGVIILEMSHRKSYVRKPYVTTSAAGEQVTTDPRTKGIEDLVYVARMYPSIPTKYRNPAAAFGRFPGYPDSLPDEVEVVWQLAELRDCRDELWGDRPAKPQAENDEVAIRVAKQGRQNRMSEIRAQGYDPSKVVIKSGCIWHPLPDRIFRKTVDMKAIQQSEAYKQTGKSNAGIALSKFVLNLKFVFVEDELKVEAQSRTTNPWK